MENAHLFVASLSKLGEDLSNKQQFSVEWFDRMQIDCPKHYAFLAPSAEPFPAACNFASSTS